jgi:hypothetical protein
MLEEAIACYIPRRVTLIDEKAPFVSRLCMVAGRADPRM